jgi:hypothetical protein
MDAARLLTNRYRLVERLGAGGMSVVWRAYDEVLGRPVAVKMLNGRYAAEAASRDRIRSEAQAAGRLSHPHVTNVYDYGEAIDDSGRQVPFVVMELVEGVTLSTRLSRGPLPWRSAAHVAAEVAAALATAHARGLVHRDIKPANVMLTANGVKVVDFGIAAVTGAHADSSPKVLGTPAYLAPERLLGSAVTPASDVYALGLLLFRMLTGHLPWQAETFTQMTNAHCYAEPEPLPPVPGLPHEVAELCARSLAKRPDDRPTAAEAARTLAAAAGTRVPLPLDEDPAWDTTDSLGEQTAIVAISTPMTDVETRLQEATGRHRRPRLAVAATASAVVVGGAVAAALLSGGQTPDRAVAADQRMRAGGTASQCDVRYRTRTDEGGTFAVDVAVANTSQQPVTGWTLRFDFAGDQTLSGGTGATWTQSGREVTAHADATLTPGATATTSFTGGYRSSNPIPTVFTLNNDRCGAVVTGAAGVPAGDAVPANDAGTAQGNAPAAGSGGSAGGSADRSGSGGSNDGKGKAKGKGKDGKDG